MSRDVPSNYEELNYVITVVGERGRREDLQKLIEDAKLNEHDGKKLEERTLEVSTPQTCTLTGYIAKDDEQLEIDIYNNPDCSIRTNTIAFSRTLGHLLTSMLQTGYQIRAKKSEMPPREKDKRKGVLRDF